MPKLYPYYTHSRLDHFRMASKSDLGNAQQITALIDKLNHKIEANKRRLSALESAFYTHIGIKQGSLDDKFRAFIGGRNDRLKNQGGTLSREQILNIIINYIEMGRDGKGGKTLLGSLGTSGTWVDAIYQILGTQDLTQLSQQELTETAKKALEQALGPIINDLFDNPQDRSNATAVVQSIIQGNQQFQLKSAEYRNMRGAFGEIVEGGQIREMITNSLRDQVIDAARGAFTSTGQMTYGKQKKEMSADLVYEFTTAAGKNVQVGWQIKSYNLNSSTARRRLTLANFTRKWAGAEAEMVADHLMSHTQYEVLTYALINYHWFNKFGEIKRDNNTIKVVKFRQRPTAIIESMKRVFGALALKNVTQDLDQMVNSNGTLNGSVQLSKTDGLYEATEKNVNIPPVFWSVSGQIFFPTRWLLEDIQKWMVNLAQQQFTPLYINVSYTGTPAYGDPLSLYQAKAKAAGKLGYPFYTNRALMQVGNRQGQSIYEGIKVQQDFAMLRNQLEAIMQGKRGIN